MLGVEVFSSHQPEKVVIDFVFSYSSSLIQKFTKTIKHSKHTCIECYINISIKRLTQQIIVGLTQCVNLGVASKCKETVLT